MTEDTRERNAGTFGALSIQSGVSPPSSEVATSVTPRPRRSAQEARERREAAFDEAIVSGGVPLDPYPGYLNWFVRECVERGTGSAIDWLCRVCRQDEDAILDVWCRLAVKDGNA